MVYFHISHAIQSTFPVHIKTGCHTYIIITTVTCVNVCTEHAQCSACMSRNKSFNQPLLNVMSFGQHYKMPINLIILKSMLCHASLCMAVMEATNGSLIL